MFTLISYLKIYFSKQLYLIQDREPFDVPEEVTWKEMSFALNSRWMMTSDTPLHNDHLMYLLEKIFSTVGGSYKI